MSLKHFKSQIDYLVFPTWKCKNFIMFATQNKISLKVPVSWLNGEQGTVFCQKFESILLLSRNFKLTLKYWNSGILVQIIHISSHFLKYTFSNIRKISLFNQMSNLCWVFRLFFNAANILGFFKDTNYQNYLENKTKLTSLLYGIYPNLPRVFCSFSCKTLILLTMEIKKYCLMYSRLCRYNFHLESAVFWEPLHNLAGAINSSSTRWQGSVAC